MMRVAMDARFLVSDVPRGMDRYLLGLARALTSRRVEVTFFHRHREPLHAQHLGIPGVVVQPLEDHGGMLWEQVAVPLALKRGRFDIYHAPAERGVPFVAPCPVVLTYHSTTTESYRDLVARGLLTGRVSDYLGYDVPRRRSWRQVYEWRQQFRADHVLTPSSFSRDELVRLNGLPGERITVTPLAVAEQFHAPRKSESDIDATLARLNIARPYLLYVGGYEPHKNVAGLFRMFQSLHAHRPDVTLVCVGSRPAPASLEGEAHRTGLGSSIRLLTGLTLELTDLYDAAQLLVSMSWRETFCLPVLEAMTRGTPAVASIWGATPELIGDASALLDPREPNAAAATVLGILNSPEHLARLRRQAVVRASQFSWAHTAALTLDVYERVQRLPMVSTR